MSWLTRYRLRFYLANSIWVAPLASLVLSIIVARVTYALDVWLLGWNSGRDPEVLRSILITLAGVVFTLVVFINSALLIVLQLASAQLSPRVIALLFRDPVTRIAMTLFVFTMGYTLTVALVIDADAPLVTTKAAAYGCVASMCVFLFLVDYLCKSLRPVVVLRRIARVGGRVIEHVYPARLTELPQRPTDGAGLPVDPRPRAVDSVKDGVIHAYDIDGLHALARRADCVIELVPQVGDYVAVGDPLFRVHGPAPAVADRELLGSVALGQERTFQQDPTFALRIIVDIASKALSPAINDPTTAVLAIDQLHRLLRDAGLRCLDEERVRDASGRLRLVYRTPGWDDFVHLAVTEIRHFGAGSIQVSRRLRAMLENLIQRLPEERAGLLRQELALLQKSAERTFSDPEDRALAGVADPQGVGSRHDDCGSARPPSSAVPRSEPVAAP